MNLLVEFRKKFGACVPNWARSFVLRHVSLLDKRTDWWESKDPYRDDPPFSTYESPYPVKVGIVKEFWHRHSHYIAACRELKVAYELIDITRADWIEAFRNSDCDIFLVHPSVQLSPWKQMFDERLRIIVNDLKKKIFPGYDELYLYESKRRMAYWLEANDIPHAKTRVFYNLAEAEQYVQSCPFPIVAKTNMGARAAGVRILRDKTGAMRYLRRVFGSGIIHGDGDYHDPDWRVAIFQEFIESDVEWRIINIGNCFMGHQKLKKGDFHSGSDRVGWLRPPDKILNFAASILARGGFQTADIDMFEDRNGNLFVNEIQALFGSFLPYQMLDNGVPGYLEKDHSKWIFHEGVFNQNASSNLRVQAALKIIGIKIDVPSLSKNVINENDIKSSMNLYQR